MAAVVDKDDLQTEISFPQHLKQSIICQRDDVFFVEACTTTDNRNLFDRVVLAPVNSPLLPTPLVHKLTLSIFEAKANRGGEEV